MAEQKYSNLENELSEESISSLATDIYCKNQLIQIYDLCNDYDNITKESEFFSRFKKFILHRKSDIDKAWSNDNIDEKTFNEAASNDSLFNRLNFFDENGTLNEDNLFNSLKDACKTKRDDKIKLIMQHINEKDTYKTAFDEILLKFGIRDPEKIKENKSRGNADKIRESLSSDFELFKLSEPMNTMIAKIEGSINEQVEKLPYWVRWVRSASDTNREIRQFFDCTKVKGIPIPRKEFLSLAGKMLSIGEDLTQQNKIKPDKIPARDSLYESYYDDIREACGNPNLTNAEISLAAAKAYRVAAEGCWKHKNKVHHDDRTNEADYIRTNVSLWIKDLAKGKNNIAKLAFLKSDDNNKYMVSTDEMWKVEMNAKHITVDHNIDLKYHNLFESKQDKQLLNSIWNLTLIIGGAVHEEKTEESEKPENKTFINSVLYYKVKIDKVPNVPLVQSYDERKSFIERVEPDKIVQLRAGKFDSAENEARQESKMTALLKILRDKNNIK